MCIYYYFFFCNTSFMAVEWKRRADQGTNVRGEEERFSTLGRAEKALEREEGKESRNGKQTHHAHSIPASG